MTERLNIFKENFVEKIQVFLNKYYRLKMKKQGYTLVGHKDNLYYGVSKQDIWQFYYTYGLKMIPITTSEGRLKAKFTYSVLLRNN